MKQIGVKTRLKKAVQAAMLSAALTVQSSNAHAGSNDDMYKTAGINIAVNGLISGIGFQNTWKWILERF